MREASIHSPVTGRAWWFILVWLLTGFDDLASRTDHASLAPANVRVASFTVNKVNVEVYGDRSYASSNGVPIASGTTYLTNVIVDKLGEVVSNVVAVSLPSTVTLGYDSNENLTNTRSCLLAYDCLNQLTNISYTNTALFPTGGRTELRYDGLGRLRVRREYTNTASPVLVEEVRYVYCGMEAIQERDGNNNPRVSYTLGGVLCRQRRRRWRRASRGVGG